jgi:PAS domain S-box-containing protein
MDDTRKILIIDDERDFVLSLTDILENYGYIIESAHDHKGATEIIDNFNADVVLLDVRLGHENGLNLLSMLKDRRPNLIPVIMTAYVETDSAIEAFHGGAYDYLRKPLSPRLLLATLERCFEKLQLEKEKRAAQETLSKRNKELEEINRKLKESEERYRQLLETMNEGLAMHDNNGTLTYVNEKLCKMIGYDRNEMVGKKISDYMDKNNQIIFNDQMKKRHAGEIHQFEIECIKKDGNRIPAIVSPQVITTSDGDFKGSFEVITDISERKMRPIDLNKEIREFEKLLKRMIPKMIEIEMNLEENLNIINADPLQLEQIIMNIAVNAKDAMGEEGKIIFTTENMTLDEDYCRNNIGYKPGDYVRLSISDTGPGMPKDIAEKIFEPFFTTKETGKGTGLGLSMVYGLVAKHDGHITCYSEPDNGTVFRIFLPAIETAEKLELKTWEKESPPEGTETILIVDDESLVRNLGERILARFGYNILTASDGESALDIYKKNRNAISLIILDLIMPGMGGKRCLEELFKIDPAIKILITSGYSTDGDIDFAMEAGARGFIKKPFDINQMLESIRRVLDAG